MKIIEDTRGTASVWLAVLAAIFGFVIFYGIMYDVVLVHFTNAILDICTPQTPQEFYTNITYFRLLFGALLFIAPLAIIYYGLVQSQKRSYYR